ncbi:MAG: SbcC/MukB-like Walker B domain-containing protein [Microcoleaceae cyanobacterium]
MRPIELTFQGFTSFRKRQVIDFSQLELFAITGPVGAGKSSILDAMTLALYGKVARNLKASELLNLGSKVLEIGLKFQVGAQQYYVYRKWEYQTKTAKVTFSLNQWIEGAWQALGEQKVGDIDAAIESILRMDFETFTRVVLLPQGEFSKFLKGSGKDRREILRQLVGYEIFEKMRSRAEVCKGSLGKEYDRLQSELANLVTHPKEILESWQDQLQTLRVQEPQLTTELTQTQIDLEKEKGLLQQIQVLSQFQAELKQHQQRQDEIKIFRQKLDASRMAERLSAPWELLTNTQKKQTELVPQFKQCASDVQSAKQSFNIQNHALNQFREQAHQTYNTLKQKRLDLEAAIGLEAQLKLQQAEVEKSKSQLKQKAQQVQQSNQKLQQITQKLQNLEQELQQADQTLAKTAPGDDSLQKSLLRFEQVQPMLQKDIMLCEQLLADCQSLQDFASELEDIQAQILNITEDCEQTQTLYNRIEADYQQAITLNYAAAIRSHLHHEDECPVCGGVYQSFSYSEEAENDAKLKILKNNLDQALNQLKSAQSLQQKSQNHLEILRSRQADLEKEFSERSKQETLLGQQINSILESSIVAEIAGNLTLNEVFSLKLKKLSELEQNYQHLRAIDQQYRQILRIKEKAEADCDRQQQLQSLTQQQFDSFQAEYEFLQESLEANSDQQYQTNVQLREKIGEASCQSFKQWLEQQEQKLNQQLEQLQTQCQQSEQTLQRLEANYDALKTQVDHLTQELSTRQSDWKKALETAGIVEADFLKSKADPVQQKQWELQVKTFNDRQLELRTQISQKQSEVGDRAATEATVEYKEQLIIQVRSRLNQVQSDIKQLDHQISQEETNRKFVQEKQQELNRVNQDYQDYNTLALDLQTNNFQEYILEEFQRELIANANVILWQLSDQRYILDYSKGNYRIEDHWNGGEQRAVSSLSGGETFAASLALALALSEKLAKGAQLDSLFIDEGFGTQDENSLEIVIQVLESLRQQQRLVGVISHVPAIGERLGTELKVEKSPEGSRIRAEGILAIPPVA